MFKRYFPKALAILLLSVLLFGNAPKAAYADEEWDKFITGEQVATIFYALEDPFIVPISVTVSGAWNEYWSGTPLGLAVLQKLSLSATLYNKYSADFVDSIDPDAYYDDGSTSSWYMITSSGSWIWHSTSDMYTEGHTYPWDWYTTNSLPTDGHVNIYAPDAMPISKTLTYRWYTHY